MAWLGKVSLGGFPDLAGAVTKLSESVKNIEKNFDSALGLEENAESGEASGLWPSATDRKAMFEPVMAFMGHKGGETVVEPLEQPESSQCSSLVEEQEGVNTSRVPPSAAEQIASAENENENEALKRKKEDEHPHTAEGRTMVVADPSEFESDLKISALESNDLYPTYENVETLDSFNPLQQKESSEVGSSEDSQSVEAKSGTDEVEQIKNDSLLALEESHHDIDSHESQDEQKTEVEEIGEKDSPMQVEASDDRRVGVESEASASNYTSIEEAESSTELLQNYLPNALHTDQAADMVSESASHDGDALVKADEVSQQVNDREINTKDKCLSSGTDVSDCADSVVEIEKLKIEMKMMEAALQGAARQSQVVIHK
ncbi:hypothetical protein HHK36_014119 [Tetracentron sinense]|uniref:Golgin candidate 5 n=1 Tax=Tetracentron sinense TaxID=13715 RepID=A0A835DHE8_TETSI|nr:hypothetical protein HHK36_014119 [Tetracentron sinense]